MRVGAEVLGGSLSIVRVKLPIAAQAEKERR